MAENPTPDLTAAAAAVAVAQDVVDKAVLALKANGGIDANQVVAYDIAHAASAIGTARSTLDYGAKGPIYWFQAKFLNDQIASTKAPTSTATGASVTPSTVTTSAVLA